MPLGHKPTQSKVDNLIKKFIQIKLYRLNLSVKLQALREAESLVN